MISDGIFLTEFISLEIFEFPTTFFKGLNSVRNSKNSDGIYPPKNFPPESILFNIFPMDITEGMRFVEILILPKQKGPNPSPLPSHVFDLVSVVPSCEPTPLCLHCAFVVAVPIPAAMPTPAAVR